MRIRELLLLNEDDVRLENPPALERRLKALRDGGFLVEHDFIQENVFFQVLRRFSEGFGLLPHEEALVHVE